MNRTRNADRAARTRETFVYSIVKITSANDYQTYMADTFFYEIHEARKGMWAISPIVISAADWLSKQTPITWGV